MSVEEFETNIAAISREAQDLDLFLHDYTPNRVKLVRHIRAIAEGVEASHERAARLLEATGTAAANIGNWMILVGIVAPIDWLSVFGRYVLVGLGSVLITIGQLGKTRTVGKTNSQQRKVAESWGEVKRLVERDRNAWAHVCDKIRHLTHLAERNEQLLVEDRESENLFSASIEMEFETVKKDIVGVVSQVVQLWLVHYAPNRAVESMDAALKTFVANVFTGRCVNIIQPNTQRAVEDDEAKKDKSGLEKLKVPVEILTLLSQLVDRECDRMRTVLPRENARRIRKLADELDVFFDP